MQALLILSLGTPAPETESWSFRELLRNIREKIMKPIDDLARFVDVGHVLEGRNQAPDHLRGLKTALRRLTHPKLLVLQLIRWASAPRRRVLRMFARLNHLS